MESVSNGTATGADNTGEYLYQTGIDCCAERQDAHRQWSAINPFPGLSTIHDGEEIGGFIGTGDQNNFLKLVAGPNGTTNVEFELESNGITIASQSLNADGLLTAQADSSLVFSLLIDRTTSLATPSVTYAAQVGRRR